MATNTIAKITLKGFIVSKGLELKDLKVDGKHWNVTYYRMIKQKGYFSKMRDKKKQAIATSLGITVEKLKRYVAAHFE